MVTTLLQRFSMAVFIRQSGKIIVSIPCIHTDVPYAHQKSTIYSVKLANHSILNEL
jgi:hypothetical protein